MTDLVTVHQLKTWPSFFAAVWDGSKQFELRKKDRDYKVGDLLVLREYDPDTHAYSGRSVVAEISFLTEYEHVCELSDEALGRDFAIISMKILGKGNA